MNDVNVVKYTNQETKKHTEETSKAYLKKALEDSNFHYYGIFTKDENLIGGISLDNVNYTNRTATLGITIGEKQEWGKGYGTEAVALMLDYGFFILNLNNIMLTVFDYNLRAKRCYEKVGFKIMGKRRKARFFAGKYHDEIYMDILAEEFKNSKIRKLLK